MCTTKFEEREHILCFTNVTRSSKTFSQELVSVSGEIYFLSDSEKDILRRIPCPPRSVPTRAEALDVTLIGCEERNDMTLDFFSKCVRGLGVDSSFFSFTSNIRVQVSVW